MRKTLAILSLTALLGACAAATPPPPAAPPAPAVSAAPAVTMSAAADPKAYYAARCAGCHAQDGSKGLKGKSADYVANALNGYKAKTYGGAKKEIMEARAAVLSADDIKALAAFTAMF
ncbi:MAG TPA: c-type cytochrome [Humidesulfovibrio sp.]|uniref:c-type cytochrome n=1 Tax=Humidesulfovibrio sp. TaxID=2910988 RepID=UPI002CE15AD3|nr:c-type cytochrome [Humidesulfovibrio sp.]HWR03023.1 c-type cytochrome [Humidesulfovibrio sp.]